jgi:hypothetical protein
VNLDEVKVIEIERYNHYSVVTADEEPLTGRIGQDEAEAVMDGLVAALKRGDHVYDAFDAQLNAITNKIMNED